ncbi:bifunctional adenosylcobinamide kinase/adenosylcobinamide-phosphate guanylyltransferase [Lysinibacillus sp. 54212]|uniref:bifunctional adenosylcobinamide kinase/adenosylcobinamide-phosphate guanylyltransferase n=1 Tax=Lysinibacillus sp. 54212 TaxID=3119829 RepID=UPI002FC9CE81
MGGRIIFITGGVRSGKSAFAENYAQQLAKNNSKSLLYIASGVSFDEEMQQRINRHKIDRLQAAIPWKTLEVPDRFPTKFSVLSSDYVLLWDCLTTWLTNIIFRNELSPNREKNITLAVEQLQDQLKEWQQKGIVVLLVSNEVLDEGASRYWEVNEYRQIIGKLHQWIVAQCDEAYELDSGIEKRWK